MASTNGPSQPIALKSTGSAMSGSNVSLDFHIQRSAPTSACGYQVVLMPFQRVTHVDANHTTTVSFDSKKNGNDIVAFDLGRFPGRRLTVWTAVNSTDLDLVPSVYVAEGYMWVYYVAYQCL